MTQVIQTREQQYNLSKLRLQLWYSVQSLGFQLSGRCTLKSTRLNWAIFWHHYSSFDIFVKVHEAYKTDQSLLAGIVQAQWNQVTHD